MILQRENEFGFWVNAFLIVQAAIPSMQTNVYFSGHSENHSALGVARIARKFSGKTLCYFVFGIFASRERIPRRREMWQLAMRNNDAILKGIYPRADCRQRREGMKSIAFDG
jgi:hypothetical protein